MLKKIVVSASFLLLSFSTYSLPDVNKQLLANQCHELSQHIELLSVEQTHKCGSIMEEAAELVERGGQFILKEFWFNARNDLHRSNRLLGNASQMQCKTTQEISEARQGIDDILEQIYGLE